MDCKNISLPLTALLGTALLKRETFSELHEGDIIVLSQRLSEPIEIALTDEKIFKGYIGIQRGKRAVEIV